MVGDHFIHIYHHDIQELLPPTWAVNIKTWTLAYINFHFLSACISIFISFQHVNSQIKQKLDKILKCCHISDCILFHRRMSLILIYLFLLQWTPEGRRLVTGASSGEFTLWNGLTFNFETILQVRMLLAVVLVRPEMCYTYGAYGV